MRGRSETVTVRDIAARAGVSVGTASKALNGVGQLRSTTRMAVFAAAVELGYDSQRLPRLTARERTYTVGVLTTDSIGRFTLPILTGAEDALGVGQMSMLLCESRADPIREQHYIRVLLARRVDGIIVTGRSSHRRPSLGQGFPVPVVYALVESDDPRDLSVLCDEVGAGRVAASHLLNLGHHQIVHVTGPRGHSGVTKRLLGVKESLAAQQLDLAAPPLHGEWSERWGREAVMELSRRDVSFDAVICGSDQIARGFADALRESGRRVPRDIALVGIDNWDAMVEGARPQLTTVDLNLAEIGRTAARELLRLIDSSDAVDAVDARPIVVPSRLVVRGSTSDGLV